MKLFACCCEWSFVVGRKHVYGAIYPMGIGDFPDALANTQRMMTRAEWEDHYSDCVACYTGAHHHSPAINTPRGLAKPASCPAKLATCAVGIVGNTRAREGGIDGFPAEPGP